MEKSKQSMKIILSTILIFMAITIMFLLVSNFLLLEKNKFYKAYISKMIEQLENYDKELESVNEYILTLDKVVVSTCQTKGK